jgi:hypothetical protein
MTDHISVAEFNILSVDEKAWYLWHGATFLHVYENGRYRVNLFHLKNFYIELWYDLEANNINKIDAFTSTDLLQPFLDRIDIECVMH